MTVSPAPAISGIEILNQLNYNPDDYAIMSDRANTAIGAWAETASIAPWWSPFPVNQRESVKTRAHTRPDRLESSHGSEPRLRRARRNQASTVPLDPAASYPPAAYPLSKGHPAPMQRVTASMSAPTRAHTATNEFDVRNRQGEKGIAGGRGQLSSKAELLIRRRS